MSDYYEKNFEKYYKATVDLDPSSFLNPLKERLEPGATILDIGCGSGRDLLWLKKRGFQPYGLEKAENLAHLARDVSGCQVMTGDVLNFDFSHLVFDALLLIGSLVHFETAEVEKVLLRIQKALTPNGLILLTLKEGVGRKQGEDGRVFVLWQESLLRSLAPKLGLRILELNRQTSLLENGEPWLGLLLARV